MKPSQIAYSFAIHKLFHEYLIHLQIKRIFNVTLLFLYSIQVDPSLNT
ncbi:hypothetical protein XFLM_09770 [Xylella fastidiosa subsp. fastidiosa GB514]|jgi:mitochondrial fission protein ELM1|nr:hypothetical protein XFLM_09770 [Xylella fastidiosa subsp. fastidiosa GB514]KAF0572087.1 hypothetical protein P305_01720 [Xylella fastidiosa subsp. fastidiosa Mus-1]SHG83966.1 hypothetical protein SAMN05660380_01558 [Xylella fastidiosa]